MKSRKIEIPEDIYKELEEIATKSKRDITTIIVAILIPYLWLWKVCKGEITEE
jgi:predicted transcriptional regulator